MLKCREVELLLIRSWVLGNEAYENRKRYGKSKLGLLKDSLYL